MELHPEARRDVPHRVERLVIGDDLYHVAWSRRRQPDSRGDRDAEVAPVAHADRRGAVHQEGAAFRQHARGVVVDHPPVPDRNELGRASHPIDPEMGEHPRDVIGTARVLDVEEDRAPVRRSRTFGLGWRYARGERGLGHRGRDLQ